MWVSLKQTSSFRKNYFCVNWALIYCIITIQTQPCFRGFSFSFSFMLISFYSNATLNRWVSLTSSALITSSWVAFCFTFISLRSIVFYFIYLPHFQLTCYFLTSSHYDKCFCFSLSLWTDHHSQCVFAGYTQFPGFTAISTFSTHSRSKSQEVCITLQWIWRGAKNSSCEGTQKCVLVCTPEQRPQRTKCLKQENDNSHRWFKPVWMWCNVCQRSIASAASLRETITCQINLNSNAEVLWISPSIIFANSLLSSLCKKVSTVWPSTAVVKVLL